MNLREARILKTLLNRYDQNEQNELLSFLPLEEKEAVINQDNSYQEIAPLLFQYQHILDRLHYSWLKPILNQCNPELMILFVNSLNSEQKQGLRNAQIPHMQLSHGVQAFLRKKIYKKLGVEDLLPLEFLPASEFSFLLDMKKNEIMNLCDFLGLYDLASEVRRIVNPVYLKTIYTSLLPKQFHYLKMCMNQKEKIVSSPLDIDFSKINNEQIKQLIHKRGLIRLGKALCGEHKDLIWYIAHTLDTGRGKILLNQYQTIAAPAVTSYLQLQVMNVINFLKKSDM